MPIPLNYQRPQPTPPKRPARLAWTPMLARSAISIAVGAVCLVAVVSAYTDKWFFCIDIVFAPMSCVICCIQVWTCVLPGLRWAMGEQDISIFERIWTIALTSAGALLSAAAFVGWYFSWR